MYICGIQKNSTDEPICKTETEAQTQRTDVWTPRREWRGGINWEIGADIYTLLCIRQITNENLQGKSKRRYNQFVG